MGMGNDIVCYIVLNTKSGIVSIPVELPIRSNNPVSNQFIDTVDQAGTAYSPRFGVTYYLAFNLTVRYLYFFNGALCRPHAAPSSAPFKSRAGRG